MFPSRKKPIAPQKAGTPLDRKQEALRAKEEQLKNAAAELQRLIDEAPRLREEQTRRRREVLAADPRLRRGARTRTGMYRHNAHTADAELMGGARRSDSRKGDVAKFILLSLALAGVIIWVIKMAIANLGA